MTQITYHQALVTIDTLEAIGEPVPAKLRSMVYNHVAKLGRQLSAIPGCELSPTPEKKAIKVKPAPKKRQRTKGNVPTKKQAPMPKVKPGSMAKFVARVN